MRVSDELDIASPVLTWCMFLALGAAVAASVVVAGLPAHGATPVPASEIPTPLPETLDPNAFPLE